MRRCIVLVLMAAFGSGQAVNAEIVSAGPSGFNIRHVAETPNIAPPVVWAALAQIGKWWDPGHTYSGDARNLTLEPVVSGCFCEKLGLYAGIEHGRVVYAQPANTLRWIGALGPLQELGVLGSMTWQIDAADGGARISLTYNVGGYADEPLSEWAAIVDEVLGGQLQRLLRFATTGNPEPPRPAVQQP